MTVAAILKHKGTDIAHIAPASSIAEAAEVLGGRRIGALLVLDSAEQLIGILSERDIVRALAEHGSRTLQMTVAQLMTSSLKTATPSTTVPEAMEMMTAGRFRHLPVLQDGKLIGIVSIGDVVKARLDAQAQEVDSLKAYVAGAA